MRRRLQKFLPIVLIALAMQIFAPIAACWAAAIAVSDPLGTAEICHDTSAGAGQQGDRSGQHRDHGGACSICCLAGASASIDSPKPVALAAPCREPARLVWREQTPNLSASRVGSNAQARAPPSIS